MARIQGISQNLSAFLDTLACSEGTAGISDDGYNVIVGGDTFSNYADHPRKLITLNKQGLKSTAAGRYQLLARYYDDYRQLLHLPDFSPISQDAIAIQQIKECHALDDVNNGLFGSAVAKCAHIWASLPGAGYGQHENTLFALQEYFIQSGGILAG